MNRLMSLCGWIGRQEVAVGKRATYGSSGDFAEHCWPFCAATGLAPDASVTEMAEGRLHGRRIVILDPGCRRMEVRPSRPADPDMGAAGLLSAAAPLSRAESPPISDRPVASQKTNTSAAHRRRVGLTADKKQGWHCRRILLHVQPASNIPNSMVRTREMGSCLAKVPSVVLRYLWARFGDFPAARRPWPSHDARAEGRGPPPPPRSRSPSCRSRFAPICDG